MVNLAPTIQHLDGFHYHKVTILKTCIHKKQNKNPQGYAIKKVISWDGPFSQQILFLNLIADKTRKEFNLAKLLENLLWQIKISKNNNSKHLLVSLSKWKRLALTDMVNPLLTYQDYHVTQNVHFACCPQLQSIEHA